MFVPACRVPDLGQSVEEVFPGQEERVGLEVYHSHRVVDPIESDEVVALQRVQDLRRCLQLPQGLQLLADDCPLLCWLPGPLSSAFGEIVLVLVPVDEIGEVVVGLRALVGLEAMRLPVVLNGLPEAGLRVLFVFGLVV